ncbi:MAG: hypothetical protein H6745_15750 [Deltaproteobacteria bacterium]|nr:hypothetical protein [Deltaproteobacteria bacterium]
MTRPRHHLAQLLALPASLALIACGSAGSATDPGAGHPTDPKAVAAPDGGAWATVLAPEGGGAAGIHLSSQPATSGWEMGWLHAAFEATAEARDAEPYDEAAIQAALDAACEREPTRPEAQRRGRIVQVVDEGGVRREQIGGCSAYEMGGEMVAALALSATRGPALAYLGGPLPTGTRLVPARDEATPERVAALREDLVALLPAELSAALPADLEGVARIVAAPLGGGRTHVAEICVPAEGDGTFCPFGALAALGADGHVRAWLWKTNDDGPKVSVPTIGGVTPLDGFGVTRVNGTLVAGDRVALWYELTSPGDEFQVLAWMGPGGVEHEGIYSLVVE